MGYDVSEVVSFLADVEHTITGAQTDPEKVITAQRAQRSGDSVDGVGVSDSGQPVVTPDTEPVEMPDEYADFGTPEAVDQILRSMTQEKE